MFPLLPLRRRTFSTVDNVFPKLSLDKAGKAMVMFLGYGFEYLITEIITTLVTN